MNTKEAVNGQLLQNLWQTAYDAHRNTSFSPEVRATNVILSYSQELTEDLNELGENKGKYQEKYTQKLTEWLIAKSRCISFMITGPANFPTSRAQKANNSEHKRYEEFRAWRAKYFKAVNTVKTKSPEEETDLALLRLDKLVILQESMKEINKLLRKFQKDKLVPEQMRKELELIEYPTSLIDRALTPNYKGSFKIPSFSLTNNNAKIKSLEQKLLIMKTRIARKETFEPIEFDGGSVQLEDDRFKIFHDQKPDATIIQEIKQNGFRWSPFWKCWTRKHTGNALYAINRLSFIQKTKEAQ